jgi:hypothetical protein
MHNREALPRTKFLVINGDIRFGKEADKAVLDSKLVGTAASVLGACDTPAVELCALVGEAFDVLHHGGYGPQTVNGARR